VDSNLIHFINNFKKEFEIPLDPVYTGKMMFGIFDLIQKGVFSASTKILAIHTGGLQGIEGMNRQLKQKRMGLIV
jgi:1-aminocyclopropane-1-carboxylate deaminase